MPTLEVLSRTQRIVVLPNTSVSIVKVGPPGPPGPQGPVGPPGSAIVSGLYVPVDGPPTTIQTAINFLLSPKINDELLSALYLLLDGELTTVATPIDFTTAPTVNGEPLAPDIPEGAFVPVDGVATSVETAIDFLTPPTVNGVGLTAPVAPGTYIEVDGAATEVETAIDFLTPPTVNGDPLTPPVVPGTYIEVDGAATTVDTAIDFTTAPTVNGLVIGGGSTVATTGTPTEVANAVANGVVLAANANRKGSSIFNDDTYGTGATAHIALGFTASATAYTVKIPPQGLYELPANYVGLVNRYSTAATGILKVTELT